RPPDESMLPDSPTYRSLGTLRFYSARTCSSSHIRSCARGNLSWKRSSIIKTPGAVALAANVSLLSRCSVSFASHYGVATAGLWSRQAGIATITATNSRARLAAASHRPCVLGSISSAGSPLDHLAGATLGAAVPAEGRKCGQLFSVGGQCTFRGAVGDLR